MIDGSPDLSGDILEDRYRLISRAGTEWFGDIYEAEQLRLNRTVSIKILATDANTPELLGRFLREAQALARLQHPGIVFVIDFGVHRGRPFLVRDVVNGESLEARLARVGQYLPEDAAPLMVAIAEALEHAHAAGVVHRHLTPSSVLFDENDRVRIGNFGLVRLLEGATGEQLTAPGTIVGWSPYTAPEQAKGGAIDGRADLYALGVIGHQLLTGKLPGYENSIHEVIALPREAASLASAIDRLRARAADARFPSAAWALNVLRAAGEELALPDASGEINTAYSTSAKPLAPPVPILPAVEAAPPRAPAMPPPLPASPPPAPPPSLPPFSPDSSISSFPSLPSIPTMALPHEPSLSVDIPGFFDAPVVARALPPAEESSLSMVSRTESKKAPPTFWKQFRHSMPTFFILIVLTGGAFGFWYFVIGLPNPIADARALVRAGKVSGVIQQLEDVVAKTPDDPELHAALGYAYVHGNSAKRALDHFAKATVRDTSALDEADIAALVGLLSLRGEDSLAAQKMLQRVGAPARPYLESSLADGTADAYVKCRAADVLHSLGLKIDLQKNCAGADETKSPAQRELIAERFAALGLTRRP